MTKGFDQQDKMLNFTMPKSAPEPQHGRKAEAAEVKPREPRSFKPRPGH